MPDIQTQTAAPGTATTGAKDDDTFKSIAELNENGEMTKFIAAPFLVIVGFVALIVLLRGLQRLQSTLFGPRYFGD